MAYSRWSEMQTANSNPSDGHYPYHHRHLYPNTQYSSYYPPNPNPSNLNLPVRPLHELNYSTSVGIEPALRPPGAEQFSSLSSYPPHTHGGGAYEAHPPGGATFAHYQTVDAAAPPAYLDPNGGISLHQYAATLYAAGGTIPQNGMQQSLQAIPNLTTWTNPTIRPRGPWKKGPKKTKIAQSAWCEVCKVECTTKDVLGQHKLGKKHMKNLEKLKAALAPVTAPAPVTLAVPNNPVIGPQENPAKVGQKKKRAVESAEDLERKKKKVLEGGAAETAVRSCPICNVVCNSETVFNFHLAGQKHASMLKKQAGQV